jgi:hypothetical protein
MFCLPVPINNTHISVRDLYISKICLSILLQGNMRSWEYINLSFRHMNVEIKTEAAQFPEKDYINGIFLAVDSSCGCCISISLSLVRKPVPLCWAFYAQPSYITLQKPCSWATHDRHVFVWVLAISHHIKWPSLKVHKIEIFFGFDFEICIISLLVMSKY